MSDAAASPSSSPGKGEFPSIGTVDAAAAPSSPPGEGGGAAPVAVDLSAGAASRKGRAELEAARAERARRQHDSVSNIVEKMNERGIGGVDLAGVEVEAFVHDKEKSRALELEAYSAALKRASDAALAAREAELAAQEEKAKKFGNDGGEGGGAYRRSESAEDNLKQAYRSAGGGGPRSSGSGSARGVDAAADGFEVAREGDGPSYGAALRPAPQARKGSVVGVYKERVGIDAGGKGNSSKTPGVPREQSKKKSDLIARYDASGRGVEVDGLHSQAYAMNASKYDATFKQRRAEGVAPGELAPQKDVDEVVGDMAERQNNVQDPISGEVVVPEKDAEADEFDRNLKAKLSAAREEAGPAPKVPMKGEGSAAKTPYEHEQQMRAKPKADEAGQDTAAEVERVVVELEDGGEDPKPDGSEEDAEEQAEKEKEAALEEEAAAARWAKEEEAELRAKEEEAELRKAEEDAAELRKVEEEAAEELAAAERAEEEKRAARAALEAEAAAAKQAEEEEAARKKAEEEAAAAAAEEERRASEREKDAGETPAKARSVPASTDAGEQADGKGGCGCVIS